MTTIGKALRKKRAGSRIVSRTAEFRRVEALPRRTSFTDYSAALTELLRKPGGTEVLRSSQAWGLWEAAQEGGLIAVFPVGEGKTLLSVLLSSIWQVSPTVIFMPAKAIHETEKKKLPQMRKHWRFPEPLLLSYEKLSKSQYADYLNDKRPQIIVCDEVHKIRRRNAARSRIQRFLNDFPNTHFAGLTGSLVEQSIRDYGHTMEFALAEKAPIPRTWSDIEDWAGAIDDGVAEGDYVQPGALQDLCREGESVRDGYRRRLLETSAVCIVVSPTAVGASLIIRETVPKVPKKVESALGKMRKIWETPGGEVVTSGLEFVRHAKELALGFYYRWVWPDDEIDFEWLDARRAWRGYVRHVIRYSSSQNPFDTEEQVKKACEAGTLTPPNGEYDEWFSIEKRSDPQTECVWISDFMVRYGLRWIKQAEKNKGKDKALAGILWVGHKSLLTAFEKEGVPTYGGGDNEILEEKESCVASIDAHGEAKNLQHQFSQACYFAVRSSGEKWEQSLGRFHRPGQPADEVVVDVPLHTIERWESFSRARARSKYQQETMSSPKKLCYAQIDIREPYEIEALKQTKSPLWDKDADWSAGEKENDDQDRS